jgi:two-component system response regulator ResD
MRDLELVHMEYGMLAKNNKQKITQKQSETMINKGKLVMDHKKHKVFWNNVALHLTRQEYNFLLI